MCRRLLLMAKHGIPLPMKRYIVFVGLTYYPSGPDDIVAVVTDEALAIAFAKDRMNQVVAEWGEGGENHHWASVYDVASEEVVWKTD